MLSLALVPLLVASAMAGQAFLAVEPIPQYTQEQNTATGEYGYSYSGGPSAKTEYRAIDGTTTGAYSYIDANGLLQSVNYIADEFGFRAAGSNIPSEVGGAPVDAPEVAAVKAAHLAEHSRATLAALGHQRRKRGIFAAAVALPHATSSQSRFQIHNSAKIVEQVHQPLYPVSYLAHPAPLLPAHSYLLRKKRGLAFAAPLAYTTSHLVPYASSSQSRFQIHKGAKLVEQVHTPVYAVPSFAALPLATSSLTALPYSSSSQSHVQIHHGANLVQQVHQPLIPAAPVVQPEPAVLTDDSIAVDASA